MPNSRLNYKSLCVTHRGNKYYYPKSIPKERGPLAIRIMILLTVLLFMVDVFMNEETLSGVLCLYASGLLFQMFLESIHRIILMSEEYCHLISRYEGRTLGMVKDALHFNTRVIVAFVISLVYCVWYLNSHEEWSVYNAGSLRFPLFLVPNVYFMGIILQLSCCPLNDSLWVAVDNGLDYGSGMAYSFFHGYLKLVLPKTGTEEKNLKELMQDYEDKNGITFDVYKLIILIPKSLTCFVSLKNEYSPSIDESSSLAGKEITVAGVQNRVYKNAVYKIISNTRNKIYVSAEYATPLKTFKDVFDTSGQHSAYYEKHKKDIILQFYLTLRNVLERTGLNEFCELIYYEDSYQDDGKTCYHDVGQIILTRLKKVREKTD